MSVILTTVARVTDWQVLQHFHRSFLVGRVKDAGATRCQVCRDVEDASQVLIVVEGADQEAIQDLGRDVDERLAQLIVNRTSDRRIWEAIEAEEYC